MDQLHPGRASAQGLKLPQGLGKLLMGNRNAEAGHALIRGGRGPIRPLGGLLDVLQEGGYPLESFNFLLNPLVFRFGLRAAFQKEGHERETSARSNAYQAIIEGK